MSIFESGLFWLVVLVLTIIALALYLALTDEPEGDEWPAPDWREKEWRK